MKDTLFYQLLVPMVGILKSEVDDDLWLLAFIILQSCPFHEFICSWDKKLTGDYMMFFHQVSVEELVTWDGVVACNF